ncbi:prepilin-type N-terminal cleavage/methylation domain-containing protein [Thalassomonas actiniarum]|uniref:Prepilin-type N-terminal cleavage/methylation domain-containing protein n=2 Tax=Thalassomonas actiniarum TaxID=485447 RepID=A0AAE9YX28_9GAMM|nr:prepilin-type N-terminal cleavage/methylation domain-containing protein [Thalassomonas actiniarum]
MNYSGKYKGLTLIEVLITMAIITILAAVVYPAYVDVTGRSNRSEAQRELSRLAFLQEQFFADNRTYTADMTDLGAPADPYITESGNYSIDAIVGAGGTTFDLKATAKGNQAEVDADCTTLSIDEALVKTASSESCWEH